MVGVVGEDGVGFDVVKSAVVLRGGWLVFSGRMESGGGCRVECC